MTALKNGVVVVWDTSILPIHKVATVPDGLSEGSPIRAMDYDPNTGTLFTASKDGITLWAVKMGDMGGAREVFRAEVT